MVRGVVVNPRPTFAGGKSSWVAFVIRISLPRLSLGSPTRAYCVQHTIGGQLVGNVYTTIQEQYRGGVHRISIRATTLEEAGKSKTG